MKYAAALACLLLFVCACKHQKNDSQTNVHDSIAFEASACEGSCPVYALTIFNTGKSTFIGKLNTIKLGEHKYKFSKEDTNRLFQYLATINVLEFRDVYESAIADFPEIVITYKEKSISIKNMRTIPSDLKILAKTLQQMARSTGYVN